MNDNNKIKISVEQKEWWLLANLFIHFVKEQQKKWKMLFKY